MDIREDKRDARRRGADAGDAIQRVIYLLRAVEFALREASTGWADEQGLTPAQGRALMFLERSRGPVTARDLARETRTAPASVTSLLAGMEERGLITRRPSPTDARSKIVEATERGRAIMREAYPSALAHQRKLFEALSPEEIEQLAGLLERLAGPEAEEGPRPPRRR